MPATKETDTSAIRKTAVIPQQPEEAFRLFTEEIAAWWPLESHSVGQANAASVKFEARVGGQIVESIDDGRTEVWGEVTACDPPSHLRFTWHPGTPPDQATEVEVRFTAHADGTAVELIHTGWDQRPDMAEVRKNYDPGWDLVFGLYAKHSSGSLTSPPAG